MPSASLNWNEIDLIVFDLDGTLYDQRKLRVLMLRALFGETVRSWSLDTMLTLRAFRRAREQLAESSVADFLNAQYEIPATWRRHPTARVRALVAEWVERRPLPLLASCRRPGVAQLFGAIRGTCKKIGIFSDYPATEKLAALGLRADFVVSSTDPDVGKLKPDTAGLHKLMRLAAVGPQRAVLIGDRIDRDGEVAKRANVRALILSQRRHPGFDCFSSFSDPLFKPLLCGPSASEFCDKVKTTV